METGEEQHPTGHGDWDMEKENRMEEARQQDLEKEEAQQWLDRAGSRGGSAASRSNDVRHSDSASPLREGPCGRTEMAAWTRGWWEWTVGAGGRVNLIWVGLIFFIVLLLACVIRSLWVTGTGTGTGRGTAGTLHSPLHLTGVIS
jgi:hypothetical protein